MSLFSHDDPHQTKFPLTLICTQINQRRGYAMSIIFTLILVSLAVALVFLAAFIWAVKSGQYDDDYTPSVRMLFDDKVVDSE